MKIHPTLSIIVFISILAITVSAVEDTSDLSEYYGFEDIEIVKLDWGISGLRIVDMDNDGRKDIVIVNNKNARIELLLQKESIGPEENEVPADPDDRDVNLLDHHSRFHKVSIPISVKIYSFVIGDLNSDGLMDLAFYGEPKGLYVQLQKKQKDSKNDTDKIAWHTRRRIRINDGLATFGALECADINHDGADDLLLAARDGVHIILQTKEKTLAEAKKYPSASTIRVIEAGDINNDKLTDLVMATTDTENPIHVRFGLETGILGPEERFFIEQPLGFDLSDCDGEYGDEVLTVDAIGKRLIGYQWTKDERTDATWPIVFYPLESGEGETERDLALADFNGDKLLDVVISDPAAAEIIFYKQVKKSGLTESLRFPAYSDVTSISAADLDGDRKSELALLSVKEKSIGISRFKDGRFTFPEPLQIDDTPLAMSLVDIDRDNKTDCIYIAKDANDTRYLKCIYSLEQSKQKESEPLILKDVVANPLGMQFIDADQDGFLDILLFLEYDKPILIRQKEKRTFEIADPTETRMSMLRRAQMYSVATADVDDNGKEELLVAEDNYARSLFIGENNQWQVLDQYNAKSRENNVTAVAAFELESKKAPSVLLLEAGKGQLQILQADEDGSYRLAHELPIGDWTATNNLSMHFAPLDGSKFANIVLFDSTKFALITVPREQASTAYLEQLFSYSTTIQDGAYGNMATGDINNDERTDLVMLDYQNNTIEILTLDDSLAVHPAMRFKVFENKSYRQQGSRRGPTMEPREMRIDDVTGDDKNDLVIVIHDRIIVYPQD